MSTSTGATRPKRRATLNKIRRNTTIDGVIIEEPLTFSVPNDDNTDQAGEGCYVSCTMHGRRYYGILIEQSVLKKATDVYFKSEASSLDLNRRMMSLKNKKSGEPPTKRVKKEVNSDGKDVGSVTDHNLSSSSLTKVISGTKNCKSGRVLVTRRVEKYRHVDPIDDADELGGGYRILSGCFLDLDAASEGNIEKGNLILEACESGGNFVGDYFYQYELVDKTLVARDTKTNAGNDEKFDIWSSLGFHTFLNSTSLPPWFPLSNMGGQQAKVLSTLQMKRNSSSVSWSKDNCNTKKESPAIPKTLNFLIPMKARNVFKVGILGGGIAGLACAFELLRLSKSEHLEVEVTILEGRDRVGGRLLTDYDTFSADGKGIPVDLGASWIHGIDKNPLANFAREFGIDFVHTNELVKMLGGKMLEIDKNVDTRILKLFDEFLDEAAKDCWKEDGIPHQNTRNQKAVRWYGSVLNSHDEGGNKVPVATDVPMHRYSSDMPIDCALAKIFKNRPEMNNLPQQDRCLMLWHTKNTEYSLAANISDISMKYWESDDMHAFEGYHVLLKQGYSKFVQSMLSNCQKHHNFKLHLNYPVKNVEYARKSTSIDYQSTGNTRKKLLDLSDTCRVSSTNNDSEFVFDSIVCALPLGVLKNRLKGKSPNQGDENKINFDPSLPSYKQDSIDNVGFGLLNKVILQFPFAFWRKPGKTNVSHSSPYLGEEEYLFGNASGLNPEHYMFYDLGKMLGDEDKTGSKPALLMTLISGMDAVMSEQWPESELVRVIIVTLKHLFSDIEVPNPLKTKRTLWGSDSFARGSYTFLPPGSTDEDYKILSSPINGKGDSLLLNENEVMRLFWTGEHTTSYHPITAHGALMSGMRAANEVIDSILLKKKFDNSNDPQIPISIFRKKYPQVSLSCQFCHMMGGGPNEGPLIAFQRGNKHALVHAYCAKYSSDVEYADGVWKNVFKELTRASKLRCAICKAYGASIGCATKHCPRSYHFQCCVGTGWDFFREERNFQCDLHRRNEENHECQISFEYFKSKKSLIRCLFCSQKEESVLLGKFLAYQKGQQQFLVHEKCLRYSSNVKQDENEEIVNFFQVLSNSKNCVWCNKEFATIKCEKCPFHFHLPCAYETKWQFKNGQQFLCPKHRSSDSNILSSNITNDVKTSATTNNNVQHDLFVTGGGTIQEQQTSKMVIMRNSNEMKSIHETEEETNQTKEVCKQESGNCTLQHETYDSSDDEVDKKLQPFDLEPHILDFVVHKCLHANRSSLEDLWGICLKVIQSQVQDQSKTVTTLRVCTDSNGEIPPHGLNIDDIILELNGIKVGSPQLQNFAQVYILMKGETELNINVVRKHTVPTADRASA